MTLESDVGCLQTIRIFRNVDPARLKLVALMSERIQYDPGDHIFHEGQRSDAAFFVLSGEVEISRDTPKGRLYALSLEAGALFGAAAILCDQAYQGDAIAKSDVVALRLSKELFFELMQSVPEFAVAVARDLAARIHHMATAVFEAEPAS